MARDRAKDLALAALAAVGLLVAVLAIAPLFGWTIVRLTTGSMAPAYPAGSLLLVHDVPAAVVVVGDIVTVDRDGRAPVTHRVVDARPTADGARLTLKGDANRTADATGYDVERVGRVVAGIPVGGRLVAAAASPYAIAITGVLAAGALLWAWWPRREPALAGIRERTE